MSEPSLMYLAYNIVVETYGTLLNDIKVGEKYILIDNDGVNYIQLGKCLENNFSPRYFANDFTHSRKLCFELNNDHPLLVKDFYGQYDVFKKVNIFHF
jgi:hypothetical protein